MQTPQRTIGGVTYQVRPGGDGTRRVAVTVRGVRTEGTAGRIGPGMTCHLEGPGGDLGRARSSRQALRLIAEAHDRRRTAGREGRGPR